MSYVSMIPSYSSMPAIAPYTPPPPPPAPKTGYGCTLTSALNYDPTAVKAVSGSCIFGNLGCTDSRFVCHEDNKFPAQCYSPDHAFDPGTCSRYFAPCEEGEELRGGRPCDRQCASDSSTTPNGRKTMHVAHPRCPGVPEPRGR